MDLKRTLLEYVQTMLAARTHQVGGGPTIIEDDELTIKLDTDGWPLAPRPISWDKVPKLKMEQLYRAYLTRHYGIFLTLLPNSLLID